MRNNPFPYLAFFFLALLVMGPCPVHGGDASQADQGPDPAPRFELDDMVVTAVKEEQTLADIPRNVSIITTGDIAQAPGNSITDLLGREGSVNLKSLFGSDKWSSIDIRGMGETAVSNVVVMRDGFRLNPPDLSGPDFSSIPLDSIERIEILRGAASVLYGDGAVGGVVNLISKKPTETPETRAFASYGSYDTTDLRVSSRGMVKKLGYNLYGDYFTTKGYRENGDLTKKDAGLELGYELFNQLTLSLSGTYHEDDYGLPGSVSLENIDNTDKRRLTDHPDDSGTSQEKGLLAHAEWDLGKWGLVKANRKWRWRDTDYVFLYTPLLPRREQVNTIDDDTRDLDIRYVKKYTAANRKGSLILGYDSRNTEYVSQRPPLKARYNSNTGIQGVFAMNRLDLTKKLDFSAGYRYAWYDGLFRKDDLKAFDRQDVWINGEAEKKTWTKNVYDLGLGFDLLEHTHVFASYSTSFRIPNADEMAAADDHLKPQDGTHLDIGLRQGFGGLAEFSLAFFNTRITDEIYYSQEPANPQGVNRNYEDATRRRGVEFEARAYPLDSLYVWANYTWMTARFEGKDTAVPLAPEHKAGLGAEWQILEPLLLAVTGTWVGERYDGNDLENNAFPKLDPYTVVDAKITYTGKKGWKIFAGVNNLFDALYETTAYSETYYPMPTRNFYGGVECAFGFPPWKGKEEG